MYTRSSGLGLLLITLLLGLTASCKKSAPEASGNNGEPNPVNRLEGQQNAGSNTIATVHWLGIKRLGTETNATHFLSLWNLPDTKKVKELILDKTALWLAGGAEGESNQSSVISHQLTPAANQGIATNNKLTAASIASTNNGQLQLTNRSPEIADSKSQRALRQLLEDLVEEEWYLEIRSGSNQPGELALAIRLNADRGLFWETNLAAFFESLTRAHPVRNGTSGWTLSVSNQPPHNNIETQLMPSRPWRVGFARSSEWTTFSYSTGRDSSLEDFRARFTKGGRPYAPATTNFWLDAQFDLSRIVGAFGLGWELPTNCPKAHLTVIGDGQDVRTHGRFDFPRTLSLELEPWNIPTNLIHDPLIGFTAIRGFRSWLSGIHPWKELQLGSTPNQAYFWAQKGLPVQNYLATPLQDASNAVDKIGEWVKQAVNPTLRNDRMGQLEDSTNFHGVVWNGAPFVAPELRSLSDTNGQFVLGGLISPTPTTEPLPSELLHEVLNRTDLVLYDWEITAEGLEHWLYFTQLTRLFFHKAQLPADSVSLTWLKNIRPMLGNCATAVTQTSPTQLTVSQRSTFGMQSIEMHLLADWIESPRFPHGLYSLIAGPPALPAQLLKTSPPVPQPRK